MKSWTCREVNKLIFVWYHAELADPEYEIESIPQIEDGSWQCHGRNEFHVTCHIQVVILVQSNSIDSVLLLNLTPTTTLSPTRS